MAIEIKSKIEDVRWPTGVRLPIMLTFEHQAGEGAPLFAGERPNYMVGGAMQYGARRGIWNILELLDQYRVKATFFVLGTTAEKYPETVQAAAKAGHEIAGMGYGFASIRTASEEQERSIVRRAAKVLQDIAGVKICGWRCPDYRVSPKTLDILAEEGLVWDSSSTRVRAKSSRSLSRQAPPTRRTWATLIRNAAVPMDWRACGTTSLTCCTGRAKKRRAC
jgi:peptidoglycan/xylan/chitin deacetylase (PgdA/CDA1 family)